MSEFDPVADAGLAFVDRARKAVVAAASGGFTTGSAAFTVAYEADHDIKKAVVAGVVAGVVGALSGLGFTYRAKANRVRR